MHAGKLFQEAASGGGGVAEVVRAAGGLRAFLEACGDDLRASRVLVFVPDGGAGVVKLVAAARGTDAASNDSQMAGGGPAAGAGAVARTPPRRRPRHGRGEPAGVAVVAPAGTNVGALAPAAIGTRREGVGGPGVAPLAPPPPTGILAAPSPPPPRTAHELLAVAMRASGCATELASRVPALINRSATLSAAEKTSLLEAIGASRLRVFASAPDAARAGIVFRVDVAGLGKEYVELVGDAPRVAARESGAAVAPAAAARCAAPLSTVAGAAAQEMHTAIAPVVPMSAAAFRASARVSWLVRGTTCEGEVDVPCAPGGVVRWLYTSDAATMERWVSEHCYGGGGGSDDGGGGGGSGGGGGVHASDLAWAVGFDMEWRPQRLKGGAPHRTALIQVRVCERHRIGARGVRDSA